ncbi:phage tail tape measure protein [Agrobacterium genomosp. 3 str. CIP 111-78]|uniref:Phage tail tape measure protein n=1 Tax=Agrobacterium tumefaciens TaxID=358 RepID=A0AAE6BRK8_AGRTU|nr:MULTISPECIES: tape measure protein [Agrobacterium tumefaciens complex]MCA2372199.1 phage tail tape measure protein [Agrobacterium tomkonis CIP 111-78]QCM02051.1 phage tail tape measure protein [Agrobacterium tumefaciens]
MAVTLDELRAVMRMEMNPFIKDLQKVNGVTAKTARLVESTWLSTNKRLDNIGRSMANSLAAPLLGIGAALSVDSVAKYADAWTSAKNSLSVAGVVGEKQGDVLDQLYKSAQNNAAPLNAMADLFGKAAQAGDNLGASQADLLKFSDGVGVALRVAGSSASQASGALTQLGQLLGQARVQAEEFNSINEGARPILMAVAVGLDEAGGSVSKLKELVNDGKVSGQQFFQAFLKGLPSIQSMAANATQTIEQGMTKVNNAFTRFIGESDESVGASQRLLAGLNALADNFDQTADVVLKVAAVIAGALVGRSIAGMIASLALATSAVIRFVTAVRAAATISGLATAMGGLSVAAGPIGAVIGVTAVGALALFASSSGEASEGAARFEERLKKMADTADAAAARTQDAGQRISDSFVNGLNKEVDAATLRVNEAKAAVIDLFDQLFRNVDRDTISPDQLAQLESLKKRLDEGSIGALEVKNALHSLANANPNFQALADAFAPLLDRLNQVVVGIKAAREQLAVATGSALSDQQIAGYKQYAASRQQGEEMLQLGKAYADEAKRQNGLSKEQLAVEKEIASIRKDLAEKGGFLPDDQIKALAASNVAASEARGKSGKSSSVKQTADSRFDADIQAVRDRTAALIEEQKILGLTYQEQEKRRMALDLEQTALADLREEARRKGATDLENIQLSSQQRTLIDQASEAYARQADALRQVEEAQNRAHDSAQEFYDTAKSGFVDVIKGTQSFSEALSNLASKVADMALNSAFDSLFGGTPKSSGGLTSFFKMLGFADGGYTGYGAKYAPAGIVHKGEYVFDADAVKKAGGPGVLEALRSRLKGYANGGSVGVPLPTFPTLAGVRPQQNFEPATFLIDVRGATGNSEIQEMVAAGVSQGISAYDKQMPDRVQQINRNPRRR